MNDEELETIRHEISVGIDYCNGGKVWDGIRKLTRLAKKKGKEETKEKIIKLFKEKSIYTGAVIKFEINSKI